MDDCNSQPESALFAWTKNGYFDQIGQGYLARKGGGGCWLCNIDQVISFC